MPSSPRYAEVHECHQPWETHRPRKKYNLLAYHGGSCSCSLVTGLGTELDENERKLGTEPAPRGETEPESEEKTPVPSVDPLPPTYLRPIAAGPRWLTPWVTPAGHSARCGVTAE